MNNKKMANITRINAVNGLQNNTDLAKFAYFVRKTAQVWML